MSVDMYIAEITHYPLAGSDAAAGKFSLDVPPVRAQHRCRPLSCT